MWRAAVVLAIVFAACGRGDSGRTASDAGTVPARETSTAAASSGPNAPRIDPTRASIVERATTPGAATPTQASAPTSPPATRASTPTDRAATAFLELERALDRGDLAAAALALGQPLPPELADLAALRRAEIAIARDDNETARARLRSDDLMKSGNRVILIRAAEAAEAVGFWDRASAFWTRATDLPTWRAEKRRTGQRAAIALAKSGASAEAVQALAAIGTVDRRDPAVGRFLTDVRGDGQLDGYHRALAAQMMGALDDARSLLRAFLAGSPGGASADAATALMRRLTAAAPAPTTWDEAVKTNTAEAYAAFRQSEPRNPRAIEAAFREGLALFRRGDVRLARDRWREAANADAGSRARFLYWMARSSEAIGDVDGARARLVDAGRQTPTTYYVARAQDRLAGQMNWPDGGPRMPPALIGPAEIEETRRWIDSWYRGAPPPADTVITRASRFLDADIRLIAGAELDASIESTEDPRSILAAGLLASERNLPHSAARAGIRLARLSPARVPLDSPRAVTRLAYPVAFDGAVGEEAFRNDLGPLLLLAMIRQESLFDPRAVSMSDARGLTQVIPSTGVEIARSLNRGGFTADDLFDVSTSIAFGARYIAVQRRAFGEDVFRALAAYNAGGGAVRRWGDPTTDPDLFVESIPVDETRTYVQQIYLHHFAYRRLAAG